MGYDYIIIGAGSAGCVLANRLSADPSCNVLLLEAGKPDRKPEIHIPGAYTKLNNTSVDWSFWTEPQEHVDGRRLYVPRGKTLGGSSSTNAMAYVRGNRKDFDEWAALGNEGWSYADLLPYFIRSENNEDFGPPWHGKGGPLNVKKAHSPSPLGEAFIRSCVANGIPRNEDYNGKEQFGASMLQFTIRNNQRHSTAAAFLKPVLGRRNLSVRTGCHVARIVIREAKAVGVEVIQAGGSTEFIGCGGEVILSAGAIQSPQVLMLSGLGDRDVLARFGIEVKAYLPGVGRNLQDHVWSGVSSYTDIPTGNSLIRPFPMVKALLQHLLWKGGPLSNSPLEANAFLSTNDSPDRPDVQFHMAPFAIAGDYTSDIYNLKTFARRDGFGILAVLIRPESRGFVTLRSADPLDPPVIQPCFLSHPADLDKLVYAVRRSIDVAEHPALKEYAPEGVHFPSAPFGDESLRTHIRRSLETLYHPVGTCRMGNDALSVVDASLRVKGIQGLRVADASVMPTIISGNTNAATVMIGEKAADLILEKLTR